MKHEYTAERNNLKVAWIRTGFNKNQILKLITKYKLISCSNLYCELGTGSEQAVATSHLLQEYSKIDERVSKLAIAFRHWAHTLEIDRPQDGSLPPYIYSLMVIYFLQRRRPIVVPVIQEVCHLLQ